MQFERFYSLNGNGVSVKPYAHQHPEKVLKHLINVLHGCGMQFERFYSINQSIVAWFAHLHQAGFQPTLTNLGKCLGW
jgi:hypothetical protein